MSQYYLTNLLFKIYLFHHIEDAYKKNHASSKLISSHFRMYTALLNPLSNSTWILLKINHKYIYFRHSLHQTLPVKIITKYI